MTTAHYFSFRAVSGVAFSGPDELIVASTPQDGLVPLYTLSLTNRTTAYVTTIRDSERTSPSLLTPLT